MLILEILIISFFLNYSILIIENSKTLKFSISKIRKNILIVIIALKSKWKELKSKTLPWSQEWWTPALRFLPYKIVKNNLRKTKDSKKNAENYLQYSSIKTNIDRNFQEDIYLIRAKQKVDFILPDFLIWNSTKLTYNKKKVSSFQDNFLKMIYQFNKNIRRSHKFENIGYLFNKRSIKWLIIKLFFQ